MKVMRLQKIRVMPGNIEEDVTKIFLPIMSNVYPNGGHPISVVPRIATYFAMGGTPIMLARYFRQLASEFERYEVVSN